MAEREENLVVFFLALFSMPFLLAIAGFVVSTLWGWFVVPLGVTDITLWHAAGLGLLVGWYTSPKKNDDKSPLENLFNSWFQAIFKFGVVLAAGAILVNHI